MTVQIPLSLSVSVSLSLSPSLNYRFCNSSRQHQLYPCSLTYNVAQSAGAVEYNDCTSIEG